MSSPRAPIVALLCCVAALFPAAGAQAAAWLPPVDLGSGAINFQTAAITPQGEAIAVWRVSAAGKYKIQASVKPPGGGFGPAADLVPFGNNIENIGIATDPAGNAIVTWRRSFGGEDIRLLYSYRPAGGAFTAAQEVTGAGIHVALPVTAMDAAGNAITVFRRAPGGDNHIAYVFRPAGGEYGAQQEITGYAGDAPRVAFAPDGSAIAAWVNNGNEVEAARRAPGGDFGTIETVSAATATTLRLAVGPDGGAVLAWPRYDGADYVMEASLAEPGGDFGPPAPLSGAGANSVAPATAVGPGNPALVAWVEEGGDQAHVATAPPGGPFGATTPLPGANVSPVAAKFSGDGSLMLISTAGKTAPTSALATARTPAGAFEPPVTLSEAGEDARPTGLSGDERGNYLTLYSNVGDGGDSILRAVGYDGEPPRFLSLSVPKRTRTGVPASFSADAFDVWGATVEWKFGDGRSAKGAAVKHRYLRTGGRRTVEVTATDPGGHSLTERRTVEVKDVTRVVIRGARFRPAKFAAKGGSMAGAAKAKRGSTLRYRLSEPARVRISFERAQRGRRKGKRCLAPGKAARGKPCTRFVRVRKAKALKRAGRTGPNRVAFAGKAGGRKLAPGRYRAVLVATDTGGLTSKPAYARFTIAPR